MLIFYHSKDYFATNFGGDAIIVKRPVISTLDKRVLIGIKYNIYDKYPTAENFSGRY